MINVLPSPLYTVSQLYLLSQVKHNAMYYRCVNILKYSLLVLSCFFFFFLIPCSFILSNKEKGWGNKEDIDMFFNIQFQWGQVFKLLIIDECFALPIINQLTLMNFGRKTWCITNIWSKLINVWCSWEFKKTFKAC